MSPQEEAKMRQEAINMAISMSTGGYGAVGRLGRVNPKTFVSGIKTLKSGKFDPETIKEVEGLAKKAKYMFMKDKQIDLESITDLSRIYKRFVGNPPRLMNIYDQAMELLKRVEAQKPFEIPHLLKK